MVNFLNMSTHQCHHCRHGDRSSLQTESSNGVQHPIAIKKTLPPSTQTQDVLHQIFFPRIELREHCTLSTKRALMNRFIIFLIVLWNIYQTLSHKCTTQLTAICPIISTVQTHSSCEGPDRCSTVFKHKLNHFFSC